MIPFASLLTALSVGTLLAVNDPAVSAPAPAEEPPTEEPDLDLEWVEVAEAGGSFEIRSGLILAGSLVHRTLREPLAVALLGPELDRHFGYADPESGGNLELEAHAALEPGPGFRVEVAYTPGDVTSVMREGVRHRISIACSGHLAGAGWKVEGASDGSLWAGLAFRH